MSAKEDIQRLFELYEELNNKITQIEYRLFTKSAKDRIDDIKERLPKIYLVYNDDD